MKAFPLVPLLLILACCNDAYGNPTNSTFSTKLTDLDDYSLLNVLDFVDFMDLLRLGSTSERIRQLFADYIFSHEYSGIAIEFGNVLTGNGFETNKMRFGELDAQLEFLKIYGNLIRHLNYRFAGDVDEIFNEYMEKYLSSDVEAIDLSGNTAHLLTRTNRTFPRVEKLELFHSEQEFVPQIERIFPNLKELIVGGTHEPHSYRFDRYERFLRALLQPVKNLRKLNVYDIKIYETLLLIRENNPTMKALAIGAYISHFGNARPIRFEHVTKFSLKLFDVRSRYRLQSEFPLHFDKLEVLEIDTITFDEILIAGLIDRNVALKSLSFINWMSSSSIVHILQRVSGTHKIEEIAFKTDDRALSSDDGIALMTSFPYLRKITILKDEDLVSNMASSDHDRILGHILPGWHVTNVVRDETQSGSCVFQRIAIERD